MKTHLTFKLQKHKDDLQSNAQLVSEEATEVDIWEKLFVSKISL